MTAQIIERDISRGFTIGQDPKAELIFRVIGTTDDSAVRSLILSNVPATYEGLDLDYIDVDPEEGGAVWKASARYSLFNTDTEIEFDTAGGTSRIATSLATISKVAAPGYTAPDYQGAINVRENRVEGADVTVPVFQFGKSVTVAAINVDPAFKNGIFQLTGCVNSQSFQGYAAGEVLFLGASGRRRGLDRWRIDYQFAASPNIVGAQVGGSSTFTISKLGWDFLWVRFDDDLDSNRVVKIPTAAYIERVYKFADLNDLGI